MTPGVEERIFQNSKKQTKNEVGEFRGGEIGIGTTTEDRTAPVGTRKKISEL